MQVKKRDGRLEEVKVEKIINSVNLICEDIKDEVDVTGIATKTVGGLYDGVTTSELDRLAISTSVSMITANPKYDGVASRLLANYIHKEVESQDIYSFFDSIKLGHDYGLISDEVLNLVSENKRKLNNAARSRYDRNKLFTYYGLQIVNDRYLLKHPESRKVIENPQYWLLRVACGLSNNAQEAIELYDLLSSLEYLTSTPTLFNSGTQHSQMSSCYLLDAPMDDLRDIEKRRQDVALLSKWAGGIGLSFSRVRGAGSLIKGTNGKSNGIVPFLHSLSANVAAVNQGGKRKGAACVYLEPWHPDIMEFLELRDNTGDHEKRGHNLNLANWIPDLFMERVRDDAVWSLIDPSKYPELPDLFGDAFRRRYEEIEAEGGYVKQMPARSIYARMMRTLAETGNGWMTWKDTCNLRCNSALGDAVVHSSNLCTEIVEPTSAGSYEWISASEVEKGNYNVIHYDQDKKKFLAIKGGEVAVCNLGSINLSKYVTEEGKLDKRKLRKNVSVAVKYLDRVIDRNFYPVHEAKASNNRWRPIGLGVMGYQDMLFKMKLPFESEEAIQLSKDIAEEIYYQALKTSVELAKELGPFDEWKNTHAANSRLQFDLAGVEPKDSKRWDELKAEIVQHGMRNSLLIAIAPTATISAIAGCYECIEPAVNNIFKRETLSGDFVDVNRYLVKDLMDLNLWSPTMVSRLKDHNGSIQQIAEIPESLKALYKTAWEIKQRAVIDHAAARGPFVDQAVSTNLFVENPDIGKLSSMYLYAWQQGLKTTYYLRSRAATRIQRLDSAESTPGPTSVDTENPDVCESCQ